MFFKVFFNYIFLKILLIYLDDFNILILKIKKLEKNFIACLGVWLWLFFKVIFTHKNMLSK